MNLLAIDTATEACSAAVWGDGKVSSRFEIVGRDHTQRLLPVVQAAMTEAGLRYADLDGIVCGVGPGSFAGVRIAVAFAKGAAFAHDLPVVGVSSLAMLAQAAISEQGASAVLAAVDARMGEVYWGCYLSRQGIAVPLQPEVVCPPHAVSVVTAQPRWHAAGTGWGVYPAELAAAADEPVFCDGKALPNALHALTLALPSFESGEAFSPDALAPTYLRNQVALTLVQQAALRGR